MRILFLGDMVGKPARRAVARFVAEKKAALGAEVVIVNGDNLAHGRSVTPRTVEEVLASGVDIVTCGDHAWDNSQALDILRAGDLNFICPCNLAGVDPLQSGRVFTAAGEKILVINLMGRVFIDKEIISPFEVADLILAENEKGEQAKIILVDFHAETTSEKKALGRYLDGRVSAVLGTHTHVQTADEEIFPAGTAYITDAGMVGIEDSILGCEVGAVLEQYTQGTAFKYKLAEAGEVEILGVLVDLDPATGRARCIERIREKILPLL
jgi:metallophosphoesterase (TIGR00282 family)